MILDTVNERIYRSANLCMNDGLILNAHAIWDTAFRSGHYEPIMDSLTYMWDVSGNDSVEVGVAMTRKEIPIYDKVGCYYINLSIADQYGCVSSIDNIVVRIAQNPIKTVFGLNDICTGDTLITEIGYSADNSNILLRKINFSQSITRVNSVRTFIPDGPQCDVQCYFAPVVFDEFPENKQITSKEEICSLCINYEHTFMGDYRLSLICPNGNVAVLKYASKQRDPALMGIQLDPFQYPNGSYGGGSMYTGVPIEGIYDGRPICDSVANPYGEGWNYCFSRNKDYRLIDNLLANTDTMGPHYLGNGNTVTESVILPPSLPHFTNAYPGGVEYVTTQASSDYENKTGYYMPWSDFSELEGCPMNGEWKVEICDYWGSDNGWVFNWSLDLCGQTDCEYQVGIDSVLWTPDTAGGAHCDYVTGKYRGVEIFEIDSVRSGITVTDTAGYFPINISIYDNFGCVWDTSTSITSVWTPRPKLDDNVKVCSNEYHIFDGKDDWADRGNYTYLWGPNDKITDTVHASGEPDQEIIYTVETYNWQGYMRCIGRDSSLIKIASQPIPNFDVDQYPLEGCEPYTINLKNTSVGATQYRWDLGDGTISTEKSLQHVYSEGSYKLTLCVANDEGCVDSISYDSVITVYPNPDARFSWSPIYPTISEPTVNLYNNTVPDVLSMKYFWEIQYDKDYPYSYHTLTAKDTSFTWDVDPTDTANLYIVRLIACSENLAPSGNLVRCRDTIENSILILKEYLQFPNMITPNGDGSNDKFVIINLLHGGAYPTNSLDIYNHSGVRVYHVDNISSEEDFWDPAKDNVPSGTYYYHFKGKGMVGSIERNGIVEVVR